MGFCYTLLDKYVKATNILEAIESFYLSQLNLDLTIFGNVIISRHDIFN